jgi:hypothetical protein
VAILAFQTEEPGMKTDLPAEDEPNEDLKLETLPASRPKQAQQFDIPIVINQRVEHFVQYFQTTAKRYSSIGSRDLKDIFPS